MKQGRQHNDQKKKRQNRKHNTEDCPEVQSKKD